MQRWALLLLILPIDSSGGGGVKFNLITQTFLNRNLLLELIATRPTLLISSKNLIDITFASQVSTY